MAMGMSINMNWFLAIEAYKQGLIVHSIVGYFTSPCHNHRNYNMCCKMQKCKRNNENTIARDNWKKQKAVRGSRRSKVLNFGNNYVMQYHRLRGHCYNGDVSFLWEKMETLTPVKSKPLNRLTHNLSGLITSTR